MKENKYEISVFKKLEPELVEAWQELEKNCHNFIFQDLNFIRNYLIYNTRLNSDNLRFVVVRFREDKKVICIFPFQIIKKFSVRILQWLGTNDFDYCSPIIKRDINLENLFNNIWKDVLNILDGYDLIFLRKQPEEIEKISNPFVKLLSCDLDSKIYLINLGSDFKDYLTSIKNKKFINEFNRTEKKLKLNNSVDLKIFNYEDKSLLPRNIIKQKVKLLNKLDEKHNFNENMVNFFDNLIINYSQKTILAALFINKKMIAACLSLIHKDRFYYLIPVIFNDDYNKYSPGKILISFLINWSSLNKIRTYDFGLGEETYKKYWSNDSIQLYRYFDFKTFKGLVVSISIKFFYFIKNYFSNKNKS